MIFAHVAVPVPARAGSLFSYSVPPEMAIEPGDLVMVPFASRVLSALVVRLDSVPPDIPTRSVLGPIPEAPSLTVEQVEVALWMARHYRCTIFDALSLFLPPAWRQAVVQASEGNDPAPRWYFRSPPSPVAEDTMVSLGPAAREKRDWAGGRSGVRARVVAFLDPRGAMEAGRLVAEVGCSLLTVRRMVAEGLLEEMGGRGDGGTGGRGDGENDDAGTRGRGDGEISAPTRGGAWPCAPTDPEPGTRNPEPDSALSTQHSAQTGLNAAQAAAFAPIADALEKRSHQVFLLHGVTGSGKTQVYFRLIELLLAQGRSAAVLVSEIAQTPEALERYAERFPGRVVVLHSALAAAERTRLWWEIRQGRFQVVIGPRSALFAPLVRLGLVVLDEEHEPAYKQEMPAPRYHAREVALQLGRRAGAVVLLGSATPDVASYHLARTGAYCLQSLPERYAGPSTHGWSAGRLPPVQVVDLRDELKAGNTGVLSRTLQAEMERVLGAGEQAILFLNRRGSATSVLCRDCGHVLKCRRCDVPLVYHKEAGELVCHQCNRRSSSPEKCPRCKRRRIAFFGVGTERVEAEVRERFPSARVLRWDHDTVVRRGAHQLIYRQFQQHRVDILVGTQMVAKALDFPLVTLVGVVLADVTLYLPDLRAAERTYQLLAQVAGRAGRGAHQGRVIVQTYSPNHYSILAAARHDYLAFFEQELAFRRYHGYPPFRRFARLLFTGTGDVRARFEALQMGKRLRVRVDELGVPDVEIIGPAPAFHSRVRGRYRWQIVLAGEGLSRLLDETLLPLGWIVDVDPVSLL